MRGASAAKLRKLNICLWIRRRPLFLFSLLMTGLEGHRQWNRLAGGRGIGGPQRRPRWGVDLSVNARRAICLYPALYIILTVPQQTFTEAKPPNHDGQYAQYYDDDENRDEWANGAVSRVNASVVSLLHYKSRWRLLIRWHWRFTPSKPRR